MGICGSLLSTKRLDEAKEQDRTLSMLKEENRKLHNIVSSLQMELHQQRSEVARMTYIAEQERLLASSYKTRFWRLRMADLLSSRRVEATRGRSP